MTVCCLVVSRHGEDVYVDTERALGAIAAVVAALRYLGVVWRVCIEGSEFELDALHDVFWQTKRLQCLV